MYTGFHSRLGFAFLPCLLCSLVRSWVVCCAWRRVDPVNRDRMQVNRDEDKRCPHANAGAEFRTHDLAVFCCLVSIGPSGLDRKNSTVRSSVRCRSRPPARLPTVAGEDQRPQEQERYRSGQRPHSPLTPAQAQPIAPRQRVSPVMYSTVRTQLRERNETCDDLSLLDHNSLSLSSGAKASTNACAKAVSAL